jgi:sugar phosphate isomerase/epimerase
VNKQVRIALPGRSAPLVISEPGWAAGYPPPVRRKSAGAQVILMASRALAARARGPRDYLEVYGELLKQADRPVILHWLGEAFDPALRGYCVIDFWPVTAAVAAAGYDGFVEVEIFNAAVWDAPPDRTAATVRERFASVLGGAAPAGAGG